MLSRQTLKLGYLDTTYVFSEEVGNVEETIQPGDTSNVEETSYFTAGFAFHKMFKSVARFVNASTKQNPR